MAIFIQGGETVNVSEFQFHSQLKRDLPTDWLIIGNAELVQAQKTAEIDAVVIGGGTVWALEAKHWWGEITGDSHYWYHNGHAHRSPINQIRAKAKILATFIRAAGRPDIYAKSLVILLACPRQPFSVQSPDTENSVIHCHDLIPKMLQEGCGQSFSDVFLQRILKSIAGGEAIKRLVKGGDKPKKPTLQNKTSIIEGANVETQHDFVFSLKQHSSGFSRIYYSFDYSKILLGRAELRGADPPIWRNWGNEGLYLHLRGGFGFEALPGIECRLNGRPLLYGCLIRPTQTHGQLNIGGLDFEYTVEEI
jgi:hypothetical protein